MKLLPLTYTGAYITHMQIDVQPFELNELFQENLRRRRKELGLSQQALADRINSKRKKNAARVHAPYISDLESGERIPLLGTLAELAEALETTPEELISPPEKISA